MTTFRDSAGIEWTIHEIRASALGSLPRNSLRHPEFKDGWLLFQSSGARKRLAPYPRDWESMSAEQLEALCSRAMPELTRPISGEFRAFHDEARR